MAPGTRNHARYNRLEVIVSKLKEKLRSLWESVAYAGLKPGSAPRPNRLARWFGPLRRPLERFLAGGRVPDDPLYLSNRTIGQRIRIALVIAVPCLLLALGVAAWIRSRHKLTNEEIAAQMLAGVDTRNLHVAANRDLEVLEATIQSNHVVSGRVRNNTARAIDGAIVYFDLTDRAGTRLAAVAAHVPRIDPNETASFNAPCDETAVYAFVREVRLPK